MAGNGRYVEWRDVEPPRNDDLKPLGRGEVYEGPEDPCTNGFWSDLFAWWRTRRERELLARVRQLEIELEIKTVEAQGLADLLECLRRHTLASTAASQRLLDTFGSPPLPEPKRKGGL